MKAVTFTCAMLLAPLAASAQSSVPLAWHSSESCPTEAQVRAWLAEELAVARRASITPVVATTFYDGDGEWSAVLHTQGRVESDEVRAQDCADLARLAVQAVIYDQAVVPRVPLRALPLWLDEAGPAAPPLVPPVATWSRLSLDLGGGAGLAFLAGAPIYAESFTDAATGATRCGSVTCYRNVEPGFAPTAFLNVNARYNATPRVGIALGMRFQFGAAPWSIAAPAGGAHKSNPFANLLLSARVYYALSASGFRPTGFVLAGFAGGGGGQIEPSPGLPSSATSSGGHVASGYGNAHAGLRFEYGISENIHLAAEVTAQLMFPAFLFDLDAALFAGVHL